MIHCVYRSHSCFTGSRASRSISLEEEERFWDLGLMGTDNPRALLRSLFYYVGLHFGLRGGKELYSLEKKNFTLEERHGQKHLVYTEMISKTNAGGLAHLKVKPKSIEVRANLQRGERCLVYLYEKYMSRCDNPEEHLWCQPIPKPACSRKWYSRQRVGIHKCENMVKSMAREAGMTGRITNHSVRKTVATRLTKRGVDHAVIRKITGHRSEAGLAPYQEVDSEQIETAITAIRGEGTCNIGNMQDTRASFTINNTESLPQQNPSAAGKTTNFNFQNCNVTINNQK